MDERPAKRSRSSVACNRCKDRRQKCDNLAPACTNCTRAHAACDYRGGDHPAWYVEALEARLRAFESAAVDAVAIAAIPVVETPPATASAGAPFTFTPAPLAVSAPPPSVDPAHLSTGAFYLPISTPVPYRGQPPRAAFPPSHLGDALGFLSLCAAAEPYYVGSSTGFSLANMVQAAVYERVLETGVPSPVASTPGEASGPDDAVRPIRDLPGQDDRPFSCHRPRDTTLPAELPADDLGALVLAAYFAKVHAFYPFLDRIKLEKQHAARADLTKPSDKLAREEHIALAKLHLVYGIGARHLQLSGRGGSFERSLPEAHFVAATVHLATVFDLRTTENIEIMLLLAVYSLHSPSGPGAWHLTGMAVRLSVELGLHRNVRGLPASKTGIDQLRKRLFWSALVLERKVAITLGRPFSLADRDIDVQPPADIEDTLRDPPAIAAAIGKAPYHRSSLSVHVHLVRLQPILATIQSHNTHLHELNPPSTEHLASVRSALEQWRDRVHAPHLPAIDSNALMIEYHKAHQLLIQPFVTVATRQREHVHACAETAGAICQLYKRVHQRQPAGFFLLELHDVLVAGITLIYCLWVDDALDPVAVMNDIGACSTVLFLIAERWESAKRYRDAFEAIVKATIGYRRAHPRVGATHVSPLTVGEEGAALFQANIWGDDEATTWRRMLGEITGTQDTAVDDWSWLGEMGFGLAGGL